MRVFVSHAGRDRAWAEWVAWQLEHAGWDITVELDCWDWQAGDNFVAKMNTALDTCDHMLALFSAGLLRARPLDRRGVDRGVSAGEGPAGVPGPGPDR